MILENKTEVTVPAVMAMQKAMNRQGCRLTREIQKRFKTIEKAGIR